MKCGLKQIKKNDAAYAYCKICQVNILIVERRKAGQFFFIFGLT